MPENITPDFSVLSRYNSNMNIELVRIGANANILESELNEMQQVANNKVRQLMRFIYTNGLSNINNMTYSGSTFTLGQCTAIIDGILINITPCTLNVVSGEDVYLDTWTTSASMNSIVRSGGNTQGAILTNYFKDPLIGMETSMREIRNYSLSKTNTKEGHDYLYIARISTGTIVKKAELITSNVSSLQSKKEDILLSTSGQKVFTLTSGRYIPGVGQLDVYLNGMRISRNAFTETSPTSFTLKANNISSGIEVVAVYG